MRNVKPIKLLEEFIIALNEHLPDDDITRENIYSDLLIFLQEEEVETIPKSLLSLDSSFSRIYKREWDHLSSDDSLLFDDE